MNNFFAGVKTFEEAKKIYRKLSKKFHPDNGGNEQDMKDLNNEFEKICLYFELYGNDTEREEATHENAQAFMDIIAKLNNCGGLVIEICGSWLWVTGETKTHKETLKELGFKWACKKQAWYLGEHGKRHKPVSMERIREKYGSEKYETKGAPNLGAAI